MEIFGWIYLPNKTVRAFPYKMAHHNAEYQISPPIGMLIMINKMAGYGSGQLLEFLKRLPPMGV